MQTIVNKLLVFLIYFYRRFISSHKNYRCAYGVENKGYTCSSYGLYVAKRYGWRCFFPLLKRRKEKCKYFSLMLNKVQKTKDNSESKNTKVSNCCGAGFPF